MINPESTTRSFGETAASLARNPLGIIALFIVLVYGFAALVTAFSSSFTATERLPLIYFLVGFPILVLAVFAWLVSNHSGKLFAPADFRDEDNYVKMQMSAVASLAVAKVTQGEGASKAEISSIVDTVQNATLSSHSQRRGGKPTILWVDDNPDNNKYTERALMSVGIRVDLALSTNEALDLIQRNSYSVIISDMGRREGPREGYVLLDAIRSNGDKTPFFIHAGSSEPEHILETQRHGGQGCMDDPEELFGMVVLAVRSNAAIPDFDAIRR